MGEIWTPESKKLGEIWTPDLKRGRYEPRTGGVMSRGRYENAPNLADLVGEATNFLADYNLFPITPNTSFFGHVLKRSTDL